MAHIRLIEPSMYYKESFLEFVQDVKDTGYQSIYHYTKAEVDFAEFVTDLIHSSKGINIEEGKIPCSSFWLVDEADEVVGVIRIRHQVDCEELQVIGHIGYEIKSAHRRKGYGSKLLELGLVEAQKIGLEQVLITCHEDNIGSRRIIEKANGLFKKSFVDPETGENMLQYEVSIYD